MAGTVGAMGILDARRVLAVQPHYDDNDIGCAGTLTLLARAGAEVCYVTVTDDLAGVLDPDLADDVARRQLFDEAREAGTIVGVSRFVDLDWPDAAGLDRVALRDQIIDLIREFRPDLVLTIDPALPDEAHQDHLITAAAVSEAVLLSGLPRVRRESGDRAVRRGEDRLLLHRRAQRHRRHLTGADRTTRCARLLSGAVHRRRSRRIARRAGSLRACRTRPMQRPTPRCSGSYRPPPSTSASPDVTDHPTSLPPVCVTVLLARPNRSATQTGIEVGAYHGWMDVRTTAGRIRSGDVSAREVVQESLDRIAATQDALNAFVYVDAEGALAAADDVDRARHAGEPLGPLAGVPFGVKDLEDCAGMPTTRGSRWYADAPPADRDDIHVARFRAAGAIPIGKTAAPEFGAFGYTASPLHGVTRNPWNTERTPGGSSGGTAASVAAGAIPFGTASDGGGSIRGPAASCGLPGLKPTYGRIPTFGVTRHAQNAVNFALATTIADTALLFDLAVGPDMRDRTSVPAPGISYARRDRRPRRRRTARRVVGRPRLRHDGPRGRVDHPPRERHADRAQPAWSTPASTCRSTTSSASMRSWSRPTSSSTCPPTGRIASTNSTRWSSAAGGATRT